MSLTARRAIEYVTQILGGSVSDEISALAVLNEAGELLEGSREWAYLVRSTGDLHFRPTVTGSAASFGYATGLLTLVGGFSAYTYVPGDTVSIDIAGTTFGTYHINSKASADALTIQHTLSADIPAVLNFTVHTSRIQLSTEVGRILNVYGTDGFTRTAFASTASELMRIDTLALVQNSFVTGYALQYNQATPASQPVPTLLLWPQPSVQEYDALSVVYLRNWPELTSDADIVPIPAYMEGLYFQFVRAVAAGYDAGESVSQRMEAAAKAVAVVMNGPQYQIAANRDAAGQSKIGTIAKTAVRSQSRAAGYDPIGGTPTDNLFTT